METQNTGSHRAPGNSGLSHRSHLDKCMPDGATLKMLSDKHVLLAGNECTPALRTCCHLCRVCAWKSLELGYYAPTAQAEDSSVDLGPNAGSECHFQKHVNGIWAFLYI